MRFLCIMLGSAREIGLFDLIGVSFESDSAFNKLFNALGSCRCYSDG